MTKLNETELNEALKSLPDWKLSNGTLLCEWELPDFATAMLFVNKVAQVAEAAGHHPDIGIRYNRVRLALSTHDAGGITEKDIALAKTLSAL